MGEPILMPFQDLPFNGDVFVCKEFLSLKKKYEINTAIETGSCLFSTTKWLGDNFENVQTVEINEEYAQHGRHKIGSNVNSVIGDSVEFIKDLKLKNNETVLFFLDAHWGNHCPLIEELECIRDLAKKYELLKPPVIVIHDFFTGNPEFGWDEYNGQIFNWEWIEPKIKEIEKEFGFEYEHYFNFEAIGAKRGLIYITPKIEKK